VTARKPVILYKEKLALWGPEARNREGLREFKNDERFGRD
jgi:hypothetical protein